MRLRLRLDVFLWLIFGLEESLVGKTLVNALADFVPQQACQVGKGCAEGHICDDVLVDARIVQRENCEVDDPDCVANHSLGVVSKLLRHCQKGEMGLLMVVKEPHGVFI